MPRIAREGVPFVVVPLLGAVAAAAAGWPLASALLLPLAAFSAFFFRDPDRVIPDDPGLVVAPADGRVVDVWRDGEETRIAVFLSVFDVHVNRMPLAGRVTESRHAPGRFLAAFRSEAASANERHDVLLQTDHGSVLVSQIAGLIARRIVCRARVGDTFASGERYGLIRFGSRTDVRLPAHAEPLVVRGERVRGGATPIARLAARPGMPA
jgi:phosphatidylserine decarboxylase